MKNTGTDVVLIQMPYAGIEYPSIALGLLKAGLQAHGIAATVVHANLLFSERIGFRNYYILSQESREDLLGEWTFSRAAFCGTGDSRPTYSGAACGDSAYFQRLQSMFPIRNPGALQYMAACVREAASLFVDTLADLILAYRPLIVGCSSSRQQHCASLALLRRLKERQPDVITMMGGANCEGDQGAVTHEKFEWVDYVVSGDADELLPRLCSRLLEQGKSGLPDGKPQSGWPAGAGMAGVMAPWFRRRPELYAGCGRSLITDLDALPYPDYSDYFEALANLERGDRISPGLPVEASRGCWWGEKSPCRFCGLNGCGMQFRMKSPDRVQAECRYLVDRYGINKLDAVDNILPREYYSTLLPALGKRNSTLPEKSGDPACLIFFETKSDLTRSRVELLKEAGIRFIQPGIETLHDSLLRLLNKGVSALQNIELLKWCLEHGVFVIWSLLFDIPGETDEAYSEMAETIPLLAHLQAPGVTRRIRFDRYSAYYYNQEAFGLSLTPFWTYEYVYPMAAKELARIASYFQDENAGVRRRGGNPGRAKCLELVAEWNRLFYRGRGGPSYHDLRDDRPVFDYEDEDGRLVMEDTRPCAVKNRHVLAGWERAVFLLCETSQSLASLSKGLAAMRDPDRGRGNGFHRHGPAADTEALLTRLVERRLILSIGKRFLSLAVPRRRCPLPDYRDFPGGSYRISGDPK